MGRKPSLRHLHVFGAKALVLNKGRRTSKAKVCIFLGYSEYSKAYRIQIPMLKKIIITRDVKIIPKMYYENGLDKQQINTQIKKKGMKIMKQKFNQLKIRIKIKMN